MKSYNSNYRFIKIAIFVLICLQLAIICAILYAQHILKDVPTIEDLNNIHKQIKQTAPMHSVYKGEFRFTHYAPTGNRTYTGSIPQAGKTIAVDPEVIPLHSIVYIENLGYFVAEDTGGAIKGNKIDIFVGSKAEAVKLGTLQGRKLKVWHMTQEGEENEIQEETSRN